jgi:hypothetical protein
MSALLGAWHRTRRRTHLGRLVWRPQWSCRATSERPRRRPKKGRTTTQPGLGGRDEKRGESVRARAREAGRRAQGGRWTGGRQLSCRNEKWPPAPSRAWISSEQAVSGRVEAPESEARSVKPSKVVVRPSAAGEGVGEARELEVSLPAG